MIVQLDSENADRNLTSQVTVLTHTPDASNPMICQGLVYFGDGGKNLDGTGGDFELTVTVGGQTIQPDPQTITFSTAVRAAVWTTPFPVPANAAVILKAKSPNAADSDVDVTAYLYDVSAEGAVVKNKLDHLVAVAESDEPVNNSIIAKLASKAATADWSDYNNTTDSLEANRDNIGTAGAGLTAVVWNATWDAEVESEVNDALVATNLDHLCLTATGAADMTAEVADNTILSRVLAAGDTSNFVPTTDGLQPIRDENVTEHDATQAAVAGIGTAGGASVNVDATTDNVLGGISGVTSGTTFLGTQQAGTTYANTSNANGVYHQINGTDSGNTKFDIVYQFLTGSGTVAVQATWVGIMNSSDDTLVFDIWRHDINAWEAAVASVTGTNPATVQTKNITLYSRHRGTSTAELGKVYLRLRCTGTLTPTVFTDQLAVSYAVTSRGSYSDGAVWLNTAASNTNTQSYVDGLPENPVSTIAAALTIATNLNLKRIRVANGSTVTFGASMANKSIVGQGWTLALGGQAIDGTYVEGAEVSGTGTCTTQAEFVDCHINNSTTTGPCRMLRCGFDMAVGTPFAGGSAGEFLFVDCFSEVAAGGATTPYFTFTGASTVQFRRYSGGANITFDAATAALTYEVIGGGNITVALAGSDVEIRGMPRSITLTGITSDTTARFVGVTGAISLAGANGAVEIYGHCGTITDSRAPAGSMTNTAASLVNINTEADTALSDIRLDHLVAVADADDPVDNSILAKLASKDATADWSDFDNTTDSLEANRDNIGAAGAGLTSVVLASTGLDAIATTAPAAVASNFREMLVQTWRRLFKKSTMTATQLKTYADNNTDVLTTQTLSDDGTTQTQGAAS